MSTEPPAIGSGATRLAGHLELTAGADAASRTFVRRQSFQAPVHLGKGHEEAGALVLNVVNPTAGLLEGDRLRVDVRVESGARLLLTTPSASRVHTMTRGGYAEVTQSFTVEAGGSLEWWPEMLIPQCGARYRQQTRIDLAPDAELIFQETIAPGRVASGEAFLYDEVRWKMDLWRGGRLLVRERYRITPVNGALTALQRRFPTAYYVSIFLASPVLTEQTAKGLLALESDDADLWSGVSMIAPGLFVVKIIAADSLALRRTLHRCRMTIYQVLGRQALDLRRAGETAPQAVVTR